MSLTQQQADTPFDLMKLRGGFGVAGQALIIASGIRRGEPLKIWSAGISMAANLINLQYGVQKKEDPQRLQEAKQEIDSVLGAQPDARTTAPASVPPTLLGQADALMQQHSVRISDGMKFGAKYMFRLAGIEAGNRANTWHGNLSMVAKVMTLAGKDEDPYTPPAQKSTLSRVREMSNLVSGGMELVAQYPLFPGAINRYNHRLGKVEQDWLQLGGASLFTAALIAKMLSPFTLTTINRDALYAYVASGLVNVPQEKREDLFEKAVDSVHAVLEKEAKLRHLPAASQATRSVIEQAIRSRLGTERLTPDGSVSAVIHEGSAAVSPVAAMAR